MGFVWDAQQGRYRDSATGRYVAESAVKQGVENVAALAAQNMRALAVKYRETPEMSLADFQRLMMREIKQAHIAAALAAHGGRAHMTHASWGRVGQLLREQYGFLTQMVAQTAQGVQRLNGRFDARAASYASAVRATFENMRRYDRAQQGYQFERNVPHANESCPECRDLTARGWVPMGTLPAVGMRQCRSNCRCSIAYRERYSAVPLADDVLLEAS